jgi:hypothetical protein
MVQDRIKEGVISNIAGNRANRKNSTCKGNLQNPNVKNGAKNLLDLKAKSTIKNFKEMFSHQNIGKKFLKGPRNNGQVVEKT